MKRETNRPAVALLFLTSLGSGVFWFNNSAIFPFIASNLNLGISVLGLMSAGFLAGVGLAQIPSGLFSMRIGLKNGILIGTTISCLATLGSAAESSPAVLILLRFVVGVGLALMFTPGVSLIASYFQHGREGFAIGIYDSFSLGGGVLAFIGDVLLASAYGWRIALIANTLFAVIVGLAFFVILPDDRFREDFKIDFPKVRNVFLDRWLLVVGFSLLGLEFASSLVGNFMVFYLSSGLKESALFAGVIASVLPIAGISSSAFFGRVFDRTKRPKALIMFLGFLSSLGLALSALNSLDGSILSTLVVGFFSGAGFIVCVAASRKLSDKHELEYEVLGVSWVITLSLFGSFFGPIFFSFVVVSVGYETAWILSGLISLGFFAPLLGSMATKHSVP